MYAMRDDRTQTTPRDRPWLRHLKELQARESAVVDAVAAQENPNGLRRVTDKTDKSPEELARLEQGESDIAWRVAALRPQVPESGPIGHLMVRPDSPTINRLHHCACCGNPLTKGRRYRCEPCQHAL